MLYEVITEKNRIITHGINLHHTIQKLKATKESTAIVINRFDYYNEMLDEIDIIQHIFSYNFV